MMWEALLTRLCAGGPLLFLGLMMAIDPDGIAQSLGGLAGALRELEDRLQGELRPEPQEAVTVSAGVRISVRLAGMAITLCTFLLLAGIVD